MRLILFALVFSLASVAMADDGKFKDRILLWSIDVPESSSVPQQDIDCRNRETELKGNLDGISKNLRAPTGKLSLYTQLYLYEPGNIPTGTGSYVCSLTALSDTAQFGFRLVKAPKHKGSTSLPLCKADLENIKAKPNILIAQLDDSWTLFQGKNCQAYGIEVGQK